MTTVVRIAGGGALLFPAGLVMGMAFPLGMKLAVGARARADAVALGSQRRGVGAGLGAERLHRADLVDLDRVLGRLALLRRGVRARSSRGAGRQGSRLMAQAKALASSLEDSRLRLEPLSPEPSTRSRDILSTA